MDVPLGHPNFGRLFPCECKLREMDERDSAELQRLSNLEGLSSQTFESFDRTVPGVLDAFNAARSYAKDPHGWLLLMGNYGCGKTHLAAAIANEAMRKKKMKVLFANTPDLLDHLRATYGPSSEVGYDKLFEAVRAVPLLIIDDLGTENATGWAREKLYQIINHRYNFQLPTVITTNHDLDDMDGRVRSRICDTRLCKHVLIDAADYRQRGIRRRRK